VGWAGPDADPVRSGSPGYRSCRYIRMERGANTATSAAGHGRPQRGTNERAVCDAPLTAPIPGRMTLPDLDTIRGAVIPRAFQRGNRWRSGSRPNDLAAGVG
jgi:hypothetical protein